METTVSSSTAAQSNVALMLKFWGDLADEEIDHSLEKDLTLQIVKNTTQKDISIVPIHSEAALRSVEILKTIWGDISSVDHDQSYVEDDHANQAFTHVVSNRQKKKKNKLQQSRGLQDDCIHTRAKS